MKPIYTMSGTGACPRVLGAKRLGYTEPPMSEDDKERLKHYTRMEQIADEQIREAGYTLEKGQLCEECLKKYGNRRYGIHVEIDTPLFTLIGHLDGRIVLNAKYPVEIKSLGDTSYNKFKNHKFEAFPDYAAQECCYLEHERVPGIYWIIERDSGKNQKYIVNDFKNELNLDGFEKITLPISFDQIQDKLNIVELNAQEGKLVNGIESDSCWFCNFRYLCIKEENKKQQIVDTPYIIKASEQYKEGIEMEKMAKKIKSSAVVALLNYAKENKVDKYKTPIASVSYRGLTTKKTFDMDILRANVSEEIMRLAEKESDPYDSYTIRLLKQGK